MSDEPNVIRVTDARVARLDAEGKVAGGFEYVKVHAMSGTLLWNETSTEWAPTIANALQSVDLSMSVTHMDMKMLGLLLGPEWRAWRRRWERHARMIRHVPRRRNKHGRTGVRR